MGIVSVAAWRLAWTADNGTCHIERQLGNGRKNGIVVTAHALIDGLL
jgi:hypothetical protein